jgi:ABC-2 type transport system ATP-binding protein
MSAVEVEGIRRGYRRPGGLLRRRPPEVPALAGVSFAVAGGETYGLLGPNGAGKTTMIRILATLLLPSAGSARVLGYDVADRPGQVRRRVGYVFGGDRGLYDRLSAVDNLRYFAELYGVPAREQRHRIAALLDQVGLAERGRDRVEGYSRGMRQRLHIARGLLHDPPVLLLDEPSIGLDPVSARELRGTVAALAAAGKTVLLTTHYLYEADELCDRIAVLRNGSIAAEGTPAALKRQVSAGEMVEVEDRGHEQLLLVRTAAAAERTGPVLACLGDLRLGRVSVRVPTLEDAYVELVGRA